MENPQVKAQMDQIQSQEQKLTAQMTNAVIQDLGPRQRTSIKKMLGAPFDRSKMAVAARGVAEVTAKPGHGQDDAASSDTADDDDDAPKAKPTTTAPPRQSIGQLHREEEEPARASR